MAHRLALIGFGTVGQGFAEILQSKENELKLEHGFDATVVAVADKLKGSAYSPEGLNLERLLSLASRSGSIDEYEGAHTGWDALRTIRESNADIVCELTYTDIETGQPATDHCRAALSAGKHVVTSNKGSSWRRPISILPTPSMPGRRSTIESSRRWPLRTACASSSRAP